jgi:chromosome segregation ATPase
MMSAKQAYVDKIEGQLKEWRASLDKLEAKAQQAEAGARVEYEKQITDLKARSAAVETELKKLKESPDNTWQTLKEGMEKAYNDLKESVQEVTSRIG